MLSGLRPDLGTELKAPLFFAELSCALLTGITAVFAAFFVSIPGRSGWWAYLPLPSLAAWALSLSYGVASDWNYMGWAEFQVPMSWACVRFISFTALPTTVVTLFLLRHAAFARPANTVILSALATTSVASAFQDLLHHLHRSASIIIWHGSTIIFLIAIFHLVGSRLINRFH